MLPGWLWDGAQYLVGEWDRAPMPTRMSEQTAKQGYLRLSEAASYLGVSERLVEREFHEGRLVGFKPTPRVLRFRAADLDAWMERGRVDAADAPVAAAVRVGRPLQARRRSAPRTA